MNEKELELELKCYKEHINPSCDTCNMTSEEIKEFYNYYKENKASDSMEDNNSSNSLSINEIEFIKEILNKKT